MLLSKIKTTESVSVHIRRGDYIDLSSIYGGICTEEYYAKAMKYFGDSQTVFYVFSNDYAFAKKQYDKDNCVVVQPEEKYPECNMDMFLMSQCKHNIIANSSYSWWGAWLNSNPGKKVIMPEKWNNKSTVDNIWCDGWIRI